MHSIFRKLFLYLLFFVVSASAKADSLTAFTKANSRYKTAQPATASKAATGVTPCVATGLKCEHLVTPLGVDAAHPRLSWQLEDTRPGARQTAYQIRVSDDSLTLNTHPLWTSGKINRADILTTYSGKALDPFTRYYWSVEVWDKDGVKSIARRSWFETGMRQQNNWKGAWISDNDDVRLKPAANFRKVFTADNTIKSARAYIAVAGLYELYINGKKAGNHRLDPMYTRFDRRTLYVTYDVTSLMQSGKNAIGVMLGNGWYNHQSTAVWNFHEAPWRGRPAFCLDLRVTYTDGTVETISSGKDWKTALGPIVFNSIYTAEHYDARKEQPGWNTVNFDDSKWKDVIYRAAPSQNIVSQQLYPIENVEEIPAAGVTHPNDSTWIYDLGRNIAGVSKVRVSGAAGTVIKLKHGEQLDKKGFVDLSNIVVHYRPTDDTDPFQTDIFTLSGKGEETFMPHFNYKGFQYVEVTSSKPVQLNKESLTGYFMHSNVPPAGHVYGSDTMINKLFAATNNAYLSNLFGYPTDCPQREKNGWTGDAQIAIETGLYSYDGITIYEKWLADHRDEQQPNGVLPSIIPTGGWGYEWGNGPDWTSTIAIIPWNIYLFYGDATLLSASYDNMRRYVNRITEISPYGLTTWGLGDWVPVKSKSPVEFTSTAYYYADALILAKAAKLFGKTDDYTYYSALAEKIKTAFNAKYLNKETGIYGEGVQTEQSVALYWGLVPDAMKSKVAANLAKRVAADNFHLDVGLLGTKSILNALSENGYADVAWKLAAQRTFPSWGWWIMNGATTLFENWDINASSDLSRNHIMFGEIGAWMYKGLAGIKPDENAPGFKNILLSPNFVEGLDHFEGSHDSPYGTVVSSWKRNGTAITYRVTVPANAGADIFFHISPTQKIYENDKPVTTQNTGKGLRYHVTAGTKEFQIR
ncbi:alpha-L-rhamnosidase [Chitinophaga ginsengisegetis]|uniref:alpha-L-rhamnosidase n=1 Tax=Chitinophaga ginsengisegetis TaxID=393003 RepID=UPI000DB97208|nr:alpha-L-rhamnosidase [Chitinophaga ginsengisegetis]MDR6567353.1 alpha-L-rhamnosidase [Chitinophaga ginsengisegetis]MDR6647084.1 alpha-L-rhamnosidase [Chitinophaga ginsengisegetis]MDR6653433.1 alpha-L-rhamnosidase [Chitinophaga ginsengisegetis]